MPTIHLHHCTTERRTFCSVRRSTGIHGFRINPQVPRVCGQRGCRVTTSRHPCAMARPRFRMVHQAPCLYRHCLRPLHLDRHEGFLCYLSRLSATSHSTEMFLQPGLTEKPHNAVKGPAPLPSRPLAHRDDARSMKRSSTPQSLHLSPSSSFLRLVTAPAVSFSIYEHKL